jgi:hypothetical protein
MAEKSPGLCCAVSKNSFVNLDQPIHYPAGIRNVKQNIRAITVFGQMPFVYEGTGLN